MDAALERFSPATREWFAGAFAAPTAAQAGAWDAISSGKHALVVAPTGSGKTLSAFLWSLDRLATTPRPDEPAAPHPRALHLPAQGARRRRRAQPALAAGRHHADRASGSGAEVPVITVGVRSGDTTSSDRRMLQREPPDILITTPESLYLMLTSAARETLAGVETVIVDEIHAVAATKRGAHLAVSLERLDAMLETPVQRIGLSATVRPIDEVARFLGGRTPVEIVQPPAQKTFDLRVIVPVEDMTELGVRTDRAGRARIRRARGDRAAERRIDLAARRQGDRRRGAAAPLDDRVRELAAAGRAADRGDERALRRDADRRRSREVPGADDRRVGRDRDARATVLADDAPILARAHHGSVSKEQRADIEDDLKSGRLRCVVATSSLELGIDMGAVDLVIQVESPPSVASGLQRVGRAGHQVGEISKGVLFPKHRADLLHTTVASERMRTGLIEAIAVPQNPLDILAQQTVAAVALDTLEVEDWWETVRRSAPVRDACRARRTRRRSICCRAGTRPTSSPSCARASCGIAWPARSPDVRARSGWP